MALFIRGGKKKETMYLSMIEIVYNGNFLGDGYRWQGGAS